MSALAALPPLPFLPSRRGNHLPGTHRRQARRPAGPCRQTPANARWVRRAAADAGEAAGAVKERKETEGKEKEEEPSTSAANGGPLKRLSTSTAALWSKRPWGKVQRLRKKVEADPSDASAQREYVAALAKRDPEAAIAYVEATERATGASVVAAYLASLVKAGKMAEWDAPAPLPSGPARDAAMAAMLERLRDRATPTPDDDSTTLDTPVGASSKQPLHVAMSAPLSSAVPSVGGGAAAAPADRSRRPTGFVKFLLDVLYSMGILVAVSLLWLMSGAALRRSLQGGPSTSSSSSAAAASSSLGTGGLSGLVKDNKDKDKDGKDGKKDSSASASSPSSSSSSAPPSSSAPNPYAPKEYNKDTIDPKQAKTFADVKGCDEAKAELAEIVDFLKDPTKYSKLGGKLPKGVLLTGPPGTGKTLLAKAVAGEAGVPFLYRSGSEFEEMFVGVGSRRVRTLFQTAKKKSPCIVFIDELDSIGGSRKQWENHTRKTLNQLLVEMDGFESNEGVIVLAATNLPESLDSALTRPGRFDRHVTVPSPDVQGRREILELYLKDKPVDYETVSIDALARGTTGFSGADLYNLVNTAAVQAAMQNLQHINGATLEFAKDKILMGAERKSAVISDENRRLTAYHESGHAIVALLTRGAYPVHKATIMPRGNALGMVMQLPDKDETSTSRQQMLARLDVCMGGRVAEELIFGPESVTSGARGDLQTATRIARHMVCECGMSNEVGPVFISDSDRGSGPYAGGVSPSLLAKVDAEVMRLLREADARVSRLLKAHENDLHKLAAALLDKETLDGDAVKSLLSPSLLAKAEAAGHRQSNGSRAPAPAKAVGKAVPASSSSSAASPSSAK